MWYDRISVKNGFPLEPSSLRFKLLIYDQLNDSIKSKNPYSTKISDVQDESCTSSSHQSNPILKQNHISNQPNQYLQTISNNKNHSSVKNCNKKIPPHTKKPIDLVSKKTSKHRRHDSFPAKIPRASPRIPTAIKCRRIKAPTLPIFRYCGQSAFGKRTPDRVHKMAADVIRSVAPQSIQNRS